LAGYQGAIAARNILLPLSDPGVLQNVPSATFTSPEVCSYIKLMNLHVNFIVIRLSLYCLRQVSSIGLTETQAKQDYGENTIGVAFQCLNDIDRALCDGSEKGFIKIVYHSKNHQILGATVMAPGAGELISEVAVAIKSKLPFDQLSTVVHSYPAYSIALQMMASEVYYEKLVRFKPVLDFLKRIGL
jgi:pyruvate/2-oxoglutarate dehydrogenase complex dihydrolipoamide dehydrogenase (E3) component